MDTLQASIMFGELIIAGVLIGVILFDWSTRD